MARVEGKNEPVLIDARSALLVIDMQYDFMPGGSLAVAGADTIIDGINNLQEKFRDVGVVVYSQDWHPPGHGSFASAHPGKKPGDPIDAPGLGPVLWPDHCVQGTRGAQIHEGLDITAADCIIRKGYHQHIDSYSAFRENDKKTRTGLAGYLKERGVEKVFTCGVATDYCCYFTAMDAASDGFSVFFVEDLTRGIDDPKGTIDARLDSMRSAGIKVIKSTDLA